VWADERARSGSIIDSQLKFLASVNANQVPNNNNNNYNKKKINCFVWLSGVD
jgi:hypothetical protein